MLRLQSAPGGIVLNSYNNTRLTRVYEQFICQFSPCGIGLETVILQRKTGCSRSRARAQSSTSSGARAAGACPARTADRETDRAGDHVRRRDGQHRPQLQPPEKRDAECRGGADKGGPVDRIGGRDEGTAKSVSVYLRDPDEK